MNLQRMWIDQPSTLQALHPLHGRLVLAYLEYGNTYRAYFTSGSTISMQISGTCLSPGWPEHLQPKEPICPSHSTKRA